MKDKKSFKEVEVSSSEKAFINEKKCISCKKCIEICRFNAIKWNEKKKKPYINHFYCEGCGACAVACKSNAIEIKPVKNGNIGWGKINSNLGFVWGELYIGESATGKIVTDVKNKAFELAREMKPQLFVVDASAGIGCPVIASLNQMEHALLVTEPFITSITDLKRILELVEHFGMEKSIIINKYDLNEKMNKKIEKIAKEHNAKVLAKIPHDLSIVEATNRLIPIVDYNHAYREIFEKIVKGLIE